MNKYLKIKIKNPDEKDLNLNINSSIYVIVYLVIGYILTKKFIGGGSFLENIAYINSNCANSAPICYIQHYLIIIIPIIGLILYIPRLFRDIRKKTKINATQNKNGYFKEIIFADDGIKIENSVPSFSRFLPYGETSLDLKINIKLYHHGFEQLKEAAIDFVFSCTDNTTLTISHNTNAPTDLIVKIIEKNSLFKGFNFIVLPNGNAEETSKVRAMFEKYMATANRSALNENTPKQKGFYILMIGTILVVLCLMKELFTLAFIFLILIVIGFFLFLKE